MLYKHEAVSLTSVYCILHTWTCCKRAMKSWLSAWVTDQPGWPSCSQFALASAASSAILSDCSTVAVSARMNCGLSMPLYIMTASRHTLSRIVLRERDMMLLLYICSACHCTSRLNGGILCQGQCWGITRHVAAPQLLFQTEVLVTAGLDNSNTAA